MSIRASHFRSEIVRPVLAALGRVRPVLDSPAAEELLVGTAAHESQLGFSLRQHPKGPARGVYQMEPDTLDDLMSWLTNRTDLRAAVLAWAIPGQSFVSQLAGNVYFATAVARLNYFRKPFTMPSADDLAGLAKVWKRWWNTEAGAGTVEQWLRHYRELAHT